jgi:hypothetical protein
LRLPLLLGEGLPEHGRDLLCRLLQRRRRGARLLRPMTASTRDASVRKAACGVWTYRLESELDAADRFRALAAALRALEASPSLVEMAHEAAADELRHASLCRELIVHFGGAFPAEKPRVPAGRIAPAGLEGRERVLYEIVALSCITETLSTALLGELVARAGDPVCKQAMHSVLRDEVNHSRLGWAFLAEERARGARDCIGRHVPEMLAAALGPNFFTLADAPDAQQKELARPERQRVVRETLESVVFPGLDRFGIETSPAKRWLELNRSDSTSGQASAPSGCHSIR